MFTRANTLMVYIGCAALLGVLFLLGPNVMQQYERNKKISDNIDALRAQMYDYNKKNDEIQGRIAFLTNLSGKEKLAREQFNMKKNGEIVVSFSPDTGQVLGAEDSKKFKVKPEPEIPNVQKWLEYFFGN